MSAAVTTACNCSFVGVPAGRYAALKLAVGTQFDGRFFVVKSPLFDAKLKTSNVFPFAGRKPLMSVALSVPPVRLALPVTTTWSYCPPGVVPPNLTSTEPAFCE